MEITIYTNEGCIWCVRTKELMARAEVEYTEIKWNSLTLDEQLKLKDELYQIISKHSGQDIKKVTNDSDRDYRMKASEAKSYGMVDEVLKKSS